jgi:hypothetical protein
MYPDGVMYGEVTRESLKRKYIECGNNLKVKRTTNRNIQNGVYETKKWYFFYIKSLNSSPVFFSFVNREKLQAFFHLLLINSTFVNSPTSILQ